MSKAYEPRLKTKYREQIRAKLQEQFNYSNPMLVPKVEKVVNAPRKPIATGPRQDSGTTPATAMPCASSARATSASSLSAAPWPCVVI